MKFSTKVAGAALGGALVATTIVAPGADAAPATPDTAALAGELASQTLDWEDCDFGDAKLNERFAKAQCATVTVPRDWHNPGDGNTFEIRISQVVNVDVDSPDYRGTVMGNPGGPGGEGLVWGPALNQFMPSLQRSHNFVGMDPRGIGQSTHAKCQVRTADLDEKDPYAAQKAIAGCQSNPDVRAVNTEQTVYDMDFIRHLLGAPKLSYVGYSYGTWLGAWYGAVFGANADKFLLDSATGVTDRTLERTFEIQAKARDRQFSEHLMNWIARHDSTYGQGTDPAAIHRAYVAAAKQIGPSLVQNVWQYTNGTGAFPNNAQYPDAGWAVALVIDAAKKQRTEGNVSASQALGATADKLAADKRAKGTKLAGLGAALADNGPGSTAETVELDLPFYWISCQDGQFDQDVAQQQREADARTKAYPLSASWGLTEVSPCVFFDTDLEKPAPGKDFPQTILVQGELDSQTAWELGRDGGLALPNTSFIAVDNEGSHGLFPYGAKTVDQPILDMFGTGTRAKDVSVVQANPLPEDATVFESWQRLNPNAKHVGEDRNDPWQPIKTGGKGHPTLAAAQLLTEQSPSGDAHADAVWQLQHRLG